MLVILGKEMNVSTCAVSVSVYECPHPRYGDDPVGLINPARLNNLSYIAIRSLSLHSLSLMDI